MEESRVLIWHRDKLKLTIITDQFLQAVFDHILGRDVVKKLMQVIFMFYILYYHTFNRDVFTVVPVIHFEGSFLLLPAPTIGRIGNCFFNPARL